MLPVQIFLQNLHELLLPSWIDTELFELWFKDHFLKYSLYLRRILNPQYLNPNVHVPVCTIKHICVTQLCDVYF